jgi:DNA-directed RNA polymerase specialized sigma24 family protein
MRHELIAMLPRLKRFADVLVGEKREGKALLRRALLRMLAEHHRYQRGTPLDRFAFTEIYRLWLAELRDHADPLRQAKASEEDFDRLFPKDCGKDCGADFDAFTAMFLGQLPPQQRSTLLLVYGEGFDTVQSRLIRASASLADRLSSGSPARVQASATIETLYPERPKEYDHDRAQ